MNRRLLMIAYHYPPVRVSSGIQRTLKFSAYLREFGWEPMVLSIDPRAYDLTSDDQMGEIPEGMVVERAFGLDTSRHLSIGGRYARFMAQPDRWVSWWPAGVWRGMAMIRKYKPAAIFSTYPITTAHLIGLTLQKLSGLPWIADCRDSLTEPGYPRDPMTWKTWHMLEKAMVRRCAKAIFTTEGTRQMYAERYPEYPASHWTVIENGYDEENFQAAAADCPGSSLGKEGQIVLIHSGVLYPKERDPRAFFAALRTLKEAGEIRAESLQVILRATGSDSLYAPMLQEYGLSDIVQLAPTVGYRTALQEMLRADGLLLFQGSVCNHQVPAKLYEYLRAGQPILGLVDLSGNTADGLRAAGANHLVDIADPYDITRGLREFLAGIREKRITGAPDEIAALHSRRSRTRELAAVLDSIVPPGR